VVHIRNCGRNIADVVVSTTASHHNCDVFFNHVFGCVVIASDILDSAIFVQTFSLKIKIEESQIPTYFKSNENLPFNNLSIVYFKHHSIGIYISG
jgi:hypothetical protein